MWSLRQVLDFLEEQKLNEIKALVNQQEESHPVKTIGRLIKRIKEKVEEEAKKYGREKG